mgnify:CR=1 FL=1
MNCQKSTCKANELLKEYAGICINNNFQPAISLLSYLLQIEDIAQNLPIKGLSKWRFKSFESLLLASGQFFGVENTAQKPRIEIGKRFEYTAQQQSPTKIYCEGVVLLPDAKVFEHAWLMDTKTGKAIDPFFNGLSYFGIPLMPQFVHQWNRGNGIISAEHGSVELLVEGLPVGAT